MIDLCSTETHYISYTLHTQQVFNYAKHREKTLKIQHQTHQHVTSAQYKLLIQSRSSGVQQNIDLQCQLVYWKIENRWSVILEQSHQLCWAQSVTARVKEACRHPKLWSAKVGLWPQVDVDGGSSIPCHNCLQVIHGPCPSVIQLVQFCRPPTPAKRE